MASSLDVINSSSDLDGRGRFFRICRLLVDGGADLLRQEFDKIIVPGDLPTVLSKEEVNLRKIKSFILTASMFHKLYPTSDTYGKSTDFDISLLMVLFRQLCRLKAPPSSNNWKTMPIDSDKSVEADILRLKIYRNEVIAHAETCSIPSDKFEQVSQDIITIFERRGGEPWKLKAERMLKEALTQSENAYLTELKDWYQHETDIKEICKQLDTKTDETLVRACRIEENVTDISNKLKSHSLSGLSLKDFEDIEKIGQGASGKVFKVKHKIDGKIYAIKRSHDSVQNRRIKDKLTKEIGILSSLVHKNVVRYYSSFLDVKDRLCIVMEYCMKDLSACFQNHQEMHNLIKRKFLEIFCEILSGLEYIHSQEIIHRDLKPSNILLSSLDSKCHAKIGDFGLARFDDQLKKTKLNSSYYQAPELVSGKYDIKADMYSAGIILFELSKREWENSEDEAHFWETVLQNLRDNPRQVLEDFKPFHPEVRRVIGSMLEDSPDVRPSAREVKEELSKRIGDDPHLLFPKERDVSGNKEIF